MGMATTPKGVEISGARLLAQRDIELINVRMSPRGSFPKSTDAQSWCINGVIFQSADIPLHTLNHL